MSQATEPSTNGTGGDLPPVTQLPEWRDDFTPDEKREYDFDLLRYLDYVDTQRKEAQAEVARLTTLKDNLEREVRAIRNALFNYELFVYYLRGILIRLTRRGLGHELSLRDYVVFHFSSQPRALIGHEEAVTRLICKAIDDAGRKVSDDELRKLIVWVLGLRQEFREGRERRDATRSGAGRTGSRPRS